MSDGARAGWYLRVVQRKDRWLPGAHEWDVWLCEAVPTGQGRREKRRKGRVWLRRRRLLLRGRERKMRIAAHELSKCWRIEVWT